MEKIYSNEIIKAFPIFQAVKDGKTIQTIDEMGYWYDLDLDEDGLSLETLINSPRNYRIKPEQKYRPFKDGDIVVYGKSVAICRKIYKHTLYFYVSIDETFGLLFDDNRVSSEGYRFAKKEEKHQLFDALAKEGKRWNPDTKLFEDLPKKCEFKPMDWCLMKDSTKYWELCQFAYTRKVHGTTIYSAVGGLIYYKCIPYNEETKHLLGTTDEWKGGENDKRVADE